MIGVLITAYGGPDRLEDVEPYLRGLRGGRPTPPELVAEIRGRYDRIGGRSPIRENTEAQAASLQRTLSERRPDTYHVAVGMRHWHPFIPDTLRSMAALGIERAIGLVMAPHFSRISIGGYMRLAEEADAPVTVDFVESWHLEPAYLRASATSVRSALQRFPVAERDAVGVIFTAHSLPEKILEWDDPYPQQLTETVTALVDRLPGIHCRFAYQSAAATREPWLGPDASELLREAAAAGLPGVVIAPIGFTTEHVEILYDIDVEYRELAERLGIRLERAAPIHDDPAVFRGLARLVDSHALRAGFVDDGARVRAR